MEERLRELEISHAVQEERLHALTDAVIANTAALATLTAAMNQTKGAWWAIVVASSIVSFGTTFLLWFLDIFKR